MAKKITKKKPVGFSKVGLFFAMFSQAKISIGGHTDNFTIAAFLDFFPESIGTNLSLGFELVKNQKNQGTNCSNF